MGCGLGDRVWGMGMQVGLKLNGRSGVDGGVWTARSQECRRGHQSEGQWGSGQGRVEGMGSRVRGVGAWTGACWWFLCGKIGVDRSLVTRGASFS